MFSGLHIFSLKFATIFRSGEGAEGIHCLPKLAKISDVSQKNSKYVQKDLGGFGNINFPIYISFRLVNYLSIFSSRAKKLTIIFFGIFSFHGRICWARRSKPPFSIENKCKHYHIKGWQIRLQYNQKQRKKPIVRWKISLFVEIKLLSWRKTRQITKKGA